MAKLFVARSCNLVAMVRVRTTTCWLLVGCCLLSPPQNIITSSARTVAPRPSPLHLDPRSSAPCRTRCATPSCSAVGKRQGALGRAGGLSGEEWLLVKPVGCWFHWP